MMMTLVPGFVYQLTVFLHIIGACMIVGIWFAHIKNPKIMRGQGHAALLMLVTGALLILMSINHFGTDTTLNYMKVGIKFLITLMLTVLIYLGQRENYAQQAERQTWANIIGLLGIINIALAVF